MNETIHWPFCENPDKYKTRGEFFRAVAREATARKGRLDVAPQMTLEGVKQLGRLVEVFKRRLRVDWAELAKRGGPPHLDPVFLALLEEGVILPEELNDEVYSTLAGVLGLRTETVRFTAEFVEYAEETPGLVGRIRRLLSRRLTTG